MAARARERGIGRWWTARSRPPICRWTSQALGCDFFACSGHKLYGPTGVGVLYGRAELLERDAALAGRRRHDREVTVERTTWRRPPARFEAGTPHDRRGRSASARRSTTSMGWAWSAIGAWEEDLLAYATERVRRDRRASGSSVPRADKAAVLSFVVEGVHPHDVGAVLDDEGIAIRAGHHCAQPLMRRFGVPATARASFAFYNTMEEVDALVRGTRAGPRGVRLMASLNELYQNVILEHNRSPRNYRGDGRRRPARRRGTIRSAATR